MKKPPRSHPAHPPYVPGLLGAYQITSIDWSKIVSTPTTLAGYGITNAYTKAEVDALFAAVDYPVDSVFGRTGAVVAAANDYTFAQLASKPTTLAGYGITDAIDGSGTAGALPKFSDANTLASSVLLESSGNIQLAGPNTDALFSRAADTGRLQIAGGSAASASNGGWFMFSGNSFSAGDRGRFQIVAGNPGTPTVDDGTITFYTGATVARWQFNRDGHLVTPTDNTYDIGKTTTERPRSLFLGTSLVINGATRINTTQPTHTASTTTVNRAATTGSTTAADVRDQLGTLRNDLRTIGILA